MSMNCGDLPSYTDSLLNNSSFRFCLLLRWARVQKFFYQAYISPPRSKLNRAIKPKLKLRFASPNFSNDVVDLLRWGVTQEKGCRLMEHLHLWNSRLTKVDTYQFRALAVNFN